MRYADVSASTVPIAANTGGNAGFGAAAAKLCRPAASSVRLPLQIARRRPFFLHREFGANMHFANLIDLPSFAVVVGGTLLATLLRCGLTDCRLAIAALGQIGRERFDAGQAKAELAVQVQEIRQDGLVRAHPHHFGDSEFDEVTDTLIGTRSIPALLAAHESHRARRLDASNRAARALAQAAELAPVFGLAGTLISLSQLPADGIARGAFAGAISMAVLTTLYGLILANLVFAPLARVVERAATDEEAERQKIVDWLALQVAGEMPGAAPRAAPRARPVALAQSA